MKKTKLDELKTQKKKIMTIKEINIGNMQNLCSYQMRSCYLFGGNKNMLVVKLLRCVSKENLTSYEKKLLIHLYK